MIPLLQLTLAQKLVLLVSVPVTGLLLYLLLRKQDEEEDDLAKSKDVATSRQTVIEVKVPRDSVGAIIGPQGANIKEIQEACGARVNFKDEVAPDVVDRTIVVRGTPESAQQAELLIHKIIADQPPIISEAIMVPQKSLGRIIGRNGDTIRTMSRQSKAKIIIDRSEEKRKDGMKEVVIKGSPLAIANAKSMIQEKVEEERVYQAKVAVTTANRPQRGKHTTPTQDTPPEGAAAHPNGGPAPACAPGVDSDGEERLREADRHLQVFVSAVEHPGHFWIQVLSSKSSELDKMVTDMTRHYSSQDDSQASQVADLMPDDIVAAPFAHDDNWYRARVLGVEEDSVDLYYVDFGDSELIPKARVQPLRSDFFNLPFQALECKLSGVQSTGPEWSEDAIDLFEALTYCARWKVLMAKTLRYEKLPSGATRPCLEIIDTNTDQNVNVAEEMVAKGYAVWGSPTHSPGVDQSSTAQVNAETDIRPIDTGWGGRSRAVCGRRPLSDRILPHTPSYIADYTIPLGDETEIWNNLDSSHRLLSLGNVEHASMVTPSFSSQKRVALKDGDDMSPSVSGELLPSHGSILHTVDTRVDEIMSEKVVGVHAKICGKFVEQHLGPSQVQSIQSLNVNEGRGNEVSKSDDLMYDDSKNDNGIKVDTANCDVSKNENANAQDINVSNNVNRDLSMHVSDVTCDDEYFDAQDVKLSLHAPRNAYKTYADCLNNRPLEPKQEDPDEMSDGLVSDMDNEAIETNDFNDDGLHNITETDEQFGSNEDIADIPNRLQMSGDVFGIEDDMLTMDDIHTFVTRPTAWSDIADDTSGYDTGSLSHCSPLSMDSPLSLASPSLWSPIMEEDQLEVIPEVDSNDLPSTPESSEYFKNRPSVEEKGDFQVLISDKPAISYEAESDLNNELLSEEGGEVEVHGERVVIQTALVHGCQMTMDEAPSLILLPVTPHVEDTSMIDQQDENLHGHNIGDDVPVSQQLDTESELPVINVFSEPVEMFEETWEVQWARGEEKKATLDHFDMEMADEHELELNDEESIDEQDTVSPIVKLKTQDHDDFSDNPEEFYEESIHTQSDQELEQFKRIDSDASPTKEKYEKICSPNLTSPTDSVGGGFFFVKEACQLERYHVTKTTLDILNWALQEAEEREVYVPEPDSVMSIYDHDQSPKSSRKNKLDSIDLKMVLHGLEPEQSFPRSAETRPTKLEEITQVKERSRSKFEAREEMLTLEVEENITQGTLSDENMDSETSCSIDLPNKQAGTGISVVPLDDVKCHSDDGKNTKCEISQVTTHHGDIGNMISTGMPAESGASHIHQEFDSTELTKVSDGPNLNTPDADKGGSSQDDCSDEKYRPGEDSDAAAEVRALLHTTSKKKRRKRKKKKVPTATLR